MRIRLSILLVLLMGGLAGCHANPPALLPVATQGAPAPLSASGFIEADSVTLAADAGAPIAAIAADEGQAVQAGQTLITLDDTLARAQRKQAAAALVAAQAVLTQTRAQARPDAVAAARAAQAGAQADYLGALQAVTDTAALVASPPGLDAQVAQAQTQVKLAEQAIQSARAARDQAQALRDQIPAGMVERDLQEQKLAGAQANLAAANAGYDGAVAALDQLQRMRQYPVESIARWHAAQSQAAIALARLQSAHAGLAAAMAAATPEQAAIAQADVQTAQANLALADEQLTHYRVSTPISGVVTSKLAQVGEVARAGAPLLVVSDLRELKLVVYIPAPQMGRIAVGDTARVTVNAYPGESFAAQIGKVASQAEFTPSNVQTKDDLSKLVFAVTLRIPNPDMRLKAGMPADVTFDR